MRVMKFGGAVLKNETGFEAMRQVLGQSKGPLLLVVSALGTATSDLQRAARRAELGNEEAALRLADKIVSKQLKFTQTLLRDKRTGEAIGMLLEDYARRLRDMLRGVAITMELTDRTLDAILSFGEYFAVRIVKHYLDEAGFNIGFADACDIIATDETHLAARALREESRQRVKEKLTPMFGKFNIVITQGFVGRSREGNITTMGMESSNFTASLLAELLRARDVTIWTDVEGVRSGDPKLVATTRGIPRLSYRQASSAALNGVKLLHPRMISPAERAGIPILFRSAFRPDGDFTTVGPDEARDHAPIVGCTEPVTLVQVNRRPGEQPIFDNSDARTLFPDGTDVIAVTQRHDALTVVASGKARLQHSKHIDVAAVRHNYAYISLVNVRPQRAFGLIARLEHDMFRMEPPLLEIGAPQNIAALTVPRSLMTQLVTELHRALCL